VIVRNDSSPTFGAVFITPKVEFFFLELPFALKPTQQLV
jgi:hypothetical protein